ncbi:ribonuclease catalytic domain-containing protein [Prochlorococcus marinus]|uniref:ribonuclease catalytic domain-containing protein n=1 Tax=Prochlorococcus marinus TaxID=1219 RepID=UPI0022B353B6|nr:ribonuclease catalytic domain-containing protein [Prochlorococcus marinus]
MINNIEYIDNTIDIKNGINIQSSKDYKDFIDLSELKTYTIDDKDSLEIDDAISLDINGSNNILWIHIACPSFYIKLNSKLDNNALLKSSTTYLIDKNIYLFPEEIIKSQLSIEHGRKNPTLSLKILFNKKKDIISAEFFKALIEPNYKLTYEEADEILDYQPKQEKELLLINEFLKSQHKKRITNGAIELEESQGKIIEKNSQLFLKIIDRTVSRKLVAEAMILYGSLFAKISKEKNILIPYRNQLERENYNKDNNVYYENKYVMNYLVKKSLSKSTIDIRPIKHHSLGLSEYTQVTSPIRRYIDFITQYQFICNLNGNIGLSKDELQLRINQYITAQKNIISAARESKNYNLLCWFKKQSINEFEVTFLSWLKYEDSIALFHFNDVYIDLACKYYPPSEIVISQNILVSIDYLNSKPNLIYIKKVN